MNQPAIKSSSARVVAGPNSGAEAVSFEAEIVAPAKTDDQTLPKTEVNGLVKDWQSPESVVESTDIDKPERNQPRPSVVKRPAKATSDDYQALANGGLDTVEENGDLIEKDAEDESVEAHKTIKKRPARSIYALAKKDPDEDLAELSYSKRKSVRKVVDADEQPQPEKRRTGLFSAFRKSVRYIPPEDKLEGEVKILSEDELAQEISAEVESRYISQKKSEEPVVAEAETAEPVGLVTSARDLINAAAKTIREEEKELKQTQPSVKEDVIMQDYEAEELSVSHDQSSRQKAPSQPTRSMDFRPTGKTGRSLARQTNSALVKSATASALSGNKVINKRPLAQTIPIVKTSLKLKPVSPRAVRIVEREDDITKIIQQQSTQTPQTAVPVVRRQPMRSPRPVRKARRRPEPQQIPVNIAFQEPLVPTQKRIPVSFFDESQPAAKRRVRVATSKNRPAVVRHVPNTQDILVKPQGVNTLEQFTIDQPSTHATKGSRMQIALSDKTVGDLKLGIIEDYSPEDALPTRAPERTIKLSKNPEDPVQMVSGLVGTPEHKRFPLGGKSPFLKTVNVEKRPLSAPVEHSAEAMTASSPSQPEQPKALAQNGTAKPFDARSYFLNEEEQKALAESKRTGQKFEKTSSKSSSRGGKKAKKDEKKSAKTTKTEKKTKKSRKIEAQTQSSVMSRPTVIVPPHRQSNGLLVLLAVVTIILGAAVGAGVYLCLTLQQHCRYEVANY